MKTFFCLFPLLFILACSPKLMNYQHISKVLEANKKQKNVKKMKDFIVTIETPFGNMDLILFDETPLHKQNFLKLASEGFYDSTLFHRVIPEFMVQGGDPNTKDAGADPNTFGIGGPGYTIPAENMANGKHMKGSLAAARTGDHMNPRRESSGSQFYIVHSENGCKHLNGQYTVFGQVLSGLDVIDKIAAVRTAPGNRPMQNVRMKMTVSELTRSEISDKYQYQFSSAN
jgi:cyclophilin family peptidyl-prolyl cis-trans isomerase